MRNLAITLVAVAALIGVAPASAQLVARHPKHASLRQIERSQKLNLAHARYLCNHGRRWPKRWGCHAVQWLTRELNETERRLHPVVTVVSYTGYRGLQGIKYANPYCESGGNPFNNHSSTYRGKWQFDQHTWNAYAPSAWINKDPATAPEYVQDQTALRVPYDAWPNC